MKQQEVRGERCQVELTQSLALYSGILLFAIIAVLLKMFYHPDLGSLLQLAESISRFGADQFSPEPLEKRIFVIGITLIPVSLLLFFRFFQKKVESLTFHKLVSYHFKTQLFNFFALIILIALIFTRKDIYSIAHRTLFEAYWYSDSLLMKHTLLALCCSIFIFIISLSFKKIFSSLYLVLSLLLISLLAYHNIAGAFTGHYPLGVHFEAVFSSVVSVYHGTPLLIDDFVNTYGLYPHFIVALFKLLQLPLSVTTFTVLMSLLILLAFAFFYRVFQKSIANHYIRHALFFFMVISVFTVKATSGDRYLQYLPIRMVFPLLVSVLILHYIDYQKRVVLLLAAFCGGLALLWNPDSGIATTTALVVFFFFEKVKIRLAFELLFSYLSAIALYLLLIKIFYGSWPNLFSLFSTINIFSTLGFFMLPMQKIHLWILWALMLYGLILKQKRFYTFMITLMLFLSLYFQGRSHTQTFYALFPYFIFTLGLYCEELVSRLRTSLSDLKYFYGFIVGLILIVPTLYLFDAPKLLYKYTFERQQLLDFDQDKEWISALDFLKKNTQKIDRAIYFSDGASGVLAIKTGVKNLLFPSYIDLFYKKDWERLEGMVKRERPFIIIDEHLIGNLSVQEIIKKNHYIKIECNAICLFH